MYLCVTECVSVFMHARTCVCEWMCVCDMCEYVRCVFAICAWMVLNECVMGDEWWVEVRIINSTAAGGRPSK